MLGYENFSLTTKSNYFVIRQLYFSFSYFLLPFVNYSQLKGLDLDGTLPDEFGNLSYLQKLDLSRNYINGSIPKSLGRIFLTKLALPGNRISGSIPNEISNIGTLESCKVLEANQLGVHLPPSLGKLSHLRRL
ncbi:putative leucine-rich repeat receptor-like serine/threonine-protein kinase [Vitis vinifera]|uniref:Putative leucine-rich repeat receptor-like serine/threonine-protein kinase n=1 Tax=Vitis vinifera TaxID=29760 RepID=A0A438E522_VITVI|nr:putative leucine-rich repeat receptor-like serine/threonine-protein kinase [Vitis vinifera]